MRRILSILAAILLFASAYAQDINTLNTLVAKGNTDAMVALAMRYESGRGVAIDSSEAYDLYRRALADPERLCPEAYAHLAKYYIRSTFVESDSAEAYALCRKAYELGSPYGYAMMGYCFEKGIGVLKDPVKAIKMYEKAAANNDGYGAYMLGWNTYWGECGLERDTLNGLICLRKGANLGDPDAMDMVARHYAAFSKKNLCWNWIKKGVAINGMRCRITEAECYAEGYGVDQDEQKALRLLQQVRNDFGDRDEVLYSLALLYAMASDSAVHDNSEALRLTQYNIQLNQSTRSLNLLADAYLHGTFAEEDLDKAYQTYLLSANRYDSEYGQYVIAAMNLYGTEPLYVQPANTRDRVDTVMHYLDKAYSHRNLESAIMLGNIYSEGLLEDSVTYLVYPNLNKAAECFRNASDWGNTDMLFDLGKIYIRQGNRDQGEAVFTEGIKKGNTNGYYWMSYSRNGVRDIRGEMRQLKKGDRKKNALCRQRLGYMYENGYLKKVKQNYGKAAKYYEQSGTDYSLYRLALLYLNGKVGKKSDKDIAKGVDALSRSAHHGHEDAMYWLGYCFETGTYMEKNYDSAVVYYKKLADNGSAEGLFKMGLFYELGDGVPQDSIKSVRCYQQAADMGHADAMCYLGDFYRMGMFVPQDQKMAFEYYTTASESENMPQMGTYYVGRSYLEGCGVEVDTATAISYIRKAAAMGVGKAYARLGDLYYSGYGVSEPGFNDSALYYYKGGSKLDDSRCDLQVGTFLYENNAFDAAVTYLYPAAKAGEPKAVYLMGMCEMNGWGIAQNREDAYELYEMVPRMTDDEEILGANYLELGYSRINGYGCEQDLALAKNYFDSAAYFDNIRGMHNLGTCYLNGYGCNEDSVIALRWYEKAADKGLAQSMAKLGDMYFSGSGAPKDAAKAVRYYERAIEAGDLDALCDLGYCYETGEGVVLNSQRAFELYSEAAEKGSTRGLFNVANCYASGIYVAENDSAAVVWYEKAANAGHHVAQYYMGLTYLGEFCKNAGIKPNKKKAKEFFKMSADQGFEPAMVALEKL